MGRNFDDRETEEFIDDGKDGEWTDAVKEHDRFGLV